MVQMIMFVKIMSSPKIVKYKIKLFCPCYLNTVTVLRYVHLPDHILDPFQLPQLELMVVQVDNHNSKFGKLVRTDGIIGCCMSDLGLGVRRMGTGHIGNECVYPSDGRGCFGRWCVG